MTLSDEDRGALRGYWLSGDLPEELARRLFGRPRDDAERERQRELRQSLHGLSGDAVHRTRRLLLTYGPSAVVRLVELMNGDSAETSRKAAVDLLRHWDGWAREELAEDASALALEHRRLTSELSDEQVEQVWSILAEGRPCDMAREDRGDASAAASSVTTDDCGDDSDGRSDDQ